MFERGLEPDFPPAEQQELANIALGEADVSILQVSNWPRIDSKVI